MQCDQKQQKVVESKFLLTGSCHQIAAVLKEYDYDVLQNADKVSKECESASQKGVVAFEQNRIRASVKFYSSPDPIVSLISGLGSVDVPSTYMCTVVIVICFLSSIFLRLICCVVYRI